MKRAIFACSLAVLSSLSFAAGAQQPTPPPPSPPAQPAAGTMASALEAARTSDYARAEKELAAIQGADRPLALVTLSRVMLAQGRFVDADKQASAAGALGGQQKFVALSVRAEILAAQGKVDDAIKLLDPQKDAPDLGGRRVRLVLGELLIRAGRRADAEPILLKFADDWNNDSITKDDVEGQAMLARAMHLLRHANDASDSYKNSVRAEIAASHGGQTGSIRPETLLWWADLFIDYYDPGDAQAELADALKIAPHNPDAMVMMARLKLEEAYDFDGAEKLVRDALAVNPKQKGAFAVRAGIGLRDMNLDAANAAIDAGLAVDPNDLELLSMRAAARFLADDSAGYDVAKREIFSRNKEYSQAYGIIAEFAEWEHRYDDVVGMMKSAVALDPSDNKAWAQLGLMQTRAGDEQDGIQSLGNAWDGADLGHGRKRRADHFNVRVKNTLQKLYKQWIPADYDSQTESIFEIRYPKAEEAVLQRYVPRMLGEAWGSMKVHYMFAPVTPVHVELYESREHFSVRTSGLPNLGIQGVCFGHVVAAMSPNSEAFNWGNVLWHELGHVFAIQLSKNHVPRWFTEGLSEYETMIRRPEWQRELDPELYVALKKNRLPPSVDLNRIFTHAEGDLDVTVAYYAASQIVAFTADQFGFPAITHALELWGTGKRTADVIREAFGVAPEEYDSRFRAWAMKRLARYEGQYMFDVKALPLDDAKAAAAAAPQTADAHVAYAFALLHAHKGDDAAQELTEALRLDPKNKDALFLSARVAGMKNDPDGEERQLRAIVKAGGDGFTVQMLLAELADSRKDKPGVRAALESAHRFDPSQPEPMRGLYDLDTEDKRDADALAALRDVAHLDQHDRQAWHLLLEKLVAAKRWDEAKRTGESALYVDIQSAGTHVNYARALAATGEHDKAAFELESALLCNAKPPDQATAHALLARERLALGDVAAARSELAQALKLDPQNEEAKSVRIP
jgi:tetratricopeptide (TPR) repeat protein